MLSVVFDLEEPGVKFGHPPVPLDLSFGTGVHVVMVGAMRLNDFHLLCAI